MRLGNMLDPEVVLEVLSEIETEIRNNGTDYQKALLYHQLGSVYGLMGEENQQKIVWQKGLELDPDNKIIRRSLKSLK